MKYKSLFLLLCFAMALDVITTLIGLSMENVYEANPILSGIVSSGNPIPLIAVKVVAIAIAVYLVAILEKYPIAQKAVYIVPSVITLIAVVFNIHTIMLASAGV